MPSRFASASASLGMFRSLVYYGLPLDYWQSYVAKVGAVDAAAVANAAAKHLDDGKAVYLVVGDGNTPVIVREGGADHALEVGGKQLTLREALAKLVTDQALGAGGLVVLDADGKPVP